MEVWSAAASCACTWAVMIMSELWVVAASGCSALGWLVLDRYDISCQLAMLLMHGVVLYVRLVCMEHVAQWMAMAMAMATCHGNEGHGHLSWQ